MALLRGLKLAAGVARTADRKTMPVLANVLLRTAGKSALTVAATDLNVSMSAEVASTNTSEGDITIVASTLLETVANAPGDELTLKKLDNQWAEIKSGKAKYKLAALPGKDFPAIAAPPAESSAMEGKTLGILIDRTMFATSTDDSRFNMTGCLWESDGKLSRMVATSGYALAKADIKTSCPAFGGRKIVVPRRGLTEIRKICESETIRVALAERSIFVSADGVCVSSKLIDAEFPNYENAIPTGHKKVVTVNRERLMESLHRIRPIATDDRGASLAASKGKLELAISVPEKGEASDEIDAEFIGDPISIGFSPRIMAEVLDHMESEQVAIAMGTEVDQIIVRPLGDKTYTCIVMPMRLS